MNWSLHLGLNLPLVLVATALNAQSTHGQRLKGDGLYDKKEYQKAEQAYGKAAIDPVAAYNAGNAAYQQGKYDAAIEWFKKSAATAADAGAKADALHNLGNAYMEQGKYAEAIAAFEGSLRQRANRPDTKKNLQIAKNKLREQQQPPPPPPPKRPPPPPPPPSPRNNYVDQGRPSQQKELPSGTMTGEAALQLLNGRIEAEEQKNARQYRALPPEAHPSRTKKDW